ncbi:hypothetical protein Mapa_003067 [Marchantia paleacea]|nr:hypothetical protein Mapa_003067 [Marchantia paleacea]
MDNNSWSHGYRMTMIFATTSVHVGSHEKWHRSRLGVYIGRYLSMNLSIFGSVRFRT